MAWTFIQRLPDEPAANGKVYYRMSVTNGVETRTEYWKGPAGLNAAELITVRDAVLDRINNPPPRNTTVREINAKILEIDAANTGTTSAIKAAKWDAVLAYRQSIVGAD